jgi:alpha-tubulin N-acetyltransferase 1
MQFNFDCEEALDCNKNGFSILEGSCQNRIVPGYRIYVKEILDKMGELSAKAQSLPTRVTSTSKFFPSDQVLILKADRNKVFGYVKVGPKKLFLRDKLFNYHERRTLCVLDFYVYEPYQRQGIGKQIFDYMLNYENIHPGLLAYDRPTLRLLAFLKKNYGLDRYTTQNNNFIIFDNFFNPEAIPTNDTEYDNDTNRVIQNLRTPQYINTNYSENNLKRYNRNNSYRGILSKSLQNQDLNSGNYNNYNREKNRDNYGNDEYNNYNRTNNVPKNGNHPMTMSPVGKQLVYNNDYTNNVVNKDVYKNPNTGFQKYYLNKEDTLAYENIYSPKKINLINDYMSSKKQNQYDFISEQNDINENSINNSNRRLNVLNNKISDIKNNNRYQEDELYNKRYDYSTLFDDKKLAEYEYRKQNKNLHRSSDFINEREYQDYQRNRNNMNGRRSPDNQQRYSPYNNNQQDAYYDDRRDGNTDYNKNNYDNMREQNNGNYY